MWDYLQYESYLILQTIISQKNHLSSSTIDYCHVFFECSKYCFYMTAEDGDFVSVNIWTIFYNKHCRFDSDRRVFDRS